MQWSGSIAAARYREREEKNNAVIGHSYCRLSSADVMKTQKLVKWWLFIDAKARRIAENQSAQQQPKKNRSHPTN